MHPKRTEIEQRLRWMIPVGAILLFGVIIAAWVRYYFLADGDETAQHATARPGTWLMIAIFATAAAPVAFFTVSKYRWLIRHGQEIPGRVLSVGSVTHSVSTPVTYGYTVGGVEYSHKRDTANTICDDYQPGSPVLVLIDPNKPGRATILHIEE